VRGWFAADGRVKTRRRECLRCRHRFTTHEKLAPPRLSRSTLRTTESASKP